MEEVKIQGGKVLDACNEVQIQVAVLVIILILTNFEKKLPSEHGGGSWQPFGICKLQICKFCSVCNMQYAPCNSALLAQEILFLTKKSTFLA